jgi:oligopeptide transport system substrate-binding protein
MRPYHHLLIGAAALLSLSLAGCSQNKSSDQNTLNWIEATELSTMDQSKATDVSSLDQINNTGSGLYRLGKHAKAKPELAATTKQSADGKTWTFTLQKNAHWSNGDKVTAKDFVYAWRRMLNPKTGAQYSYLFSGIKNADQISSGKAPVKSLGIKAIGKYKLKVSLDKRIPYFKLLLAFPVFYPQNERAVKQYGSKYGTTSKYMVYNGPFIQKGWSGSTLSWHLVKNPHYWDKKAVKLHRINFNVQKTSTTSYNLYQSGKLDTSTLSKQAAQELKHNKGFKIHIIADTQFLDLSSQRVPALRNLKIRQALSMAINRQSLANTLGTAIEPATTFTPTQLTQYQGKDYTTLVKNKATKAVTSYRPKAAAKLFKEGLAETGLTSLHLSLTTFDTDYSKAAGEALQSQWEQALPGLKVSVQSIPLKSALARGEDGNFDLLLNDWIADFADPISFLDLNVTGNSNNYGHWSNQRYDQLISDSKNTASTKKRFHDLAAAEQVLLTNQGVIPLFHANEAWIARPNVKGIIYNSGANDYKYAYKTK